MNDTKSAENKEEFEQVAKLFNGILIPLIEDFIEAFVTLIHEIGIAVNLAFREIAQYITRQIIAVIKLYPNKRVVYLALHHPRERVRKKNMRRILKWIERGEKPFAQLQTKNEYISPTESTVPRA